MDNTRRSRTADVLPPSLTGTELHDISLVFVDIHVEVIYFERK